MNPKINKNGFTLVEVIVSIAIISIIAIAMLNVLGTGFSNLFRSGRNSKDYYEAAGELEIATLDPEYGGKKNNPSIKTIKHEEIKIKLFDKYIKTRFIRSKIGDLDSELNGDNYLFIYAIDKDLGYEEGQAYISKDGTTVGFKQGDIPVPKELLEGNYKYNGRGILIIPSKEALKLDSKYPIAWEVKDGIYVTNFESSDQITLGTVNTEGIDLNSPDGSIILNGTIINSGGKIRIKSRFKLEMRSTIVKSRIGDILLEAKESIDIEGTEERPTEISVKLATNHIILETNGTILRNAKTILIHGFDE